MRELSVDEWMFAWTELCRKAGMTPVAEECDGGCTQLRTVSTGRDWVSTIKDTVSFSWLGKETLRGLDTNLGLRQPRLSQVAHGVISQA